MKKLFHVSMPAAKGSRAGPFPFTAYQEGRAELPEIVPLSALERKVTPEFKTVSETVEFEIDDGAGRAPRLQVQTTRKKVRAERQATGRAVIRHALEIEADSEAEAEAVFRKALGINAEGTSRPVVAVPVGSPDAPDAPTPAPKGKGKHKPTADEAALALLGGKAPLEI